MASGTVNIASESLWRWNRRSYIREGCQEKSTEGKSSAGFWEVTKAIIRHVYNISGLWVEGCLSKSELQEMVTSAYRLRSDLKWTVGVSREHDCTEAKKNGVSIVVWPFLFWRASVDCVRVGEG